MTSNSTWLQANCTDACWHPSSSAGVAVGLPLFFIFLAIVIGVLAFIYWNKIRTLLGSVQRRDQEKEVSAESPQIDDNQYTSMTRGQLQPQPQSPIYENLGNKKAPFNRPDAEQSRLPAQSEEDVYIQCEEIDDGIYSNDPEFNPKPPEPHDEDVYLMPDS
ncbi:protein GAPT-like [Poecilia latipinna]|uniref:protein GAPT-like n=1 Tax=Poecilia latipinna TaxID=48699 RepID=UPI00072E86FC|nr:PREDICTED: protein GAPT-like [Poecilia latipinna]